MLDAHSCQATFLLFVIVLIVANDDLTPPMDCFDYDNDCDNDNDRWRWLWT